jgi:hypothetical protein
VESVNCWESYSYVNSQFAPLLGVQEVVGSNPAGPICLTVNRGDLREW